MYLKADHRNPHMGLDNKVCDNPKYWCRLHQVWLSEDDVKRKRCFERLTIDMIAYRKCSNIVEKGIKDE